MAFISEPWKYLTWVCCRFSKPSNSKSGSALKVQKNLDSYLKSLLFIVLAYLVFIFWQTLKMLKAFLPNWKIQQFVGLLYLQLCGCVCVDSRSDILLVGMLTLHISQKRFQFLGHTVDQIVRSKLPSTSLNPWHS